MHRTVWFMALLVTFAVVCSREIEAQNSRDDEVGDVANRVCRQLEWNDDALEARIRTLVVETLAKSPDLELTEGLRPKIASSFSAMISPAKGAIRRDPEGFATFYRGQLTRLQPRMALLKAKSFDRDADAVRAEFRLLFDRAFKLVSGMVERHPGMNLDPEVSVENRPAPKAVLEAVRQALDNRHAYYEQQLEQFLFVAEYGSDFKLTAARQVALAKRIESQFVYRSIATYIGRPQLVEIAALLPAIGREDTFDIPITASAKWEKSVQTAYMRFRLRHRGTDRIPPHWGVVPEELLNGDDLLDSDLLRHMLSPRPQPPRLSATQLGNLDQALGVWSVGIRRHVEVHDFVGNEIIGELLGESWLKKATQLAELEGRKQDSDFQWSELELELLATWRIAYQHVPMIVEPPKLSHAEYQAKLRQWHEQFNTFLTAVVAGSNSEEFPEEWMRHCAEPHRVLLQDVQAWLDERHAHESTDPKRRAFAFGVRARILLNYVDVDQVKRHPNRIRGQNRVLYYLLQPLDEDATSYKGWIAREQPLPDDLPADLKPVAEAFQRYVQVAKRTNPIFESLDHSANRDELAQRQYKHMTTTRGDEERAAHEAVVTALDAAFVQRWAAHNKSNSDSANTNVPSHAIKEQANSPPETSSIPATTPDSNRGIPTSNPVPRQVPESPLVLSAEERRQLDANHRAKQHQSYGPTIAILIVAALGLVFWWKRRSAPKSRN